MSFEKDMRRLEEIVESLDNESVELDKALTLFEEGLKVLKSASKALSGAEKKVKMLIEGADGAIEAQDFERE